MNYLNKIFFLISLLLFTNTYSQNRQGGDRDAMMAQYQNMNFNISGIIFIENKLLYIFLILSFFSSLFLSLKKNIE